VTTINPAYTASEVGRQLTMSRTKMILAQKHSLPVVEEAVLKANSTSALQTARVRIPTGCTESVQEKHSNAVVNFNLICVDYKYY
jgi:hypothetical protein